MFISFHYLLHLLAPSHTYFLYPLKGKFTNLIADPVFAANVRTLIELNFESYWILGDNCGKYNHLKREREEISLFVSNETINAHFILFPVQGFP